MNRRFLFLSAMALGAMWFHVWKRLLVPCGGSPAVQAGLLAVVLGLFLLQVTVWLPVFGIEQRPRLRFWIYSSYGLMVALWFGAIANDIFVLTASLLMPRDASWQVSLPYVAQGLLFVTTVGNSIGIWTVRRGPIIRTVEVRLPNWPAALDGFRIAQISDLHVGPLIKADYVEDVVRKVQSLNPGLIAVTGDLGDGHVAKLRDDLVPLRQLRADHGVYYVTGNHEFYWNAHEWVDAARDCGMTVLHNEGRSIDLGAGSLWVGGVPDISASRFGAGFASEPALAAPPSDLTPNAKVLLAHQPKSCFAAAAAGFDLMLCGHTHWGQTFPITLIVGWFNPYHRGLNQHGQMAVYVSAGTGFWGPPVRFGVAAEVTCVVLRSA